ncbi:MAG: hypothetical protein Q6373_010700 [Candidatus Sigynarchaeota archaeon]
MLAAIDTAKQMRFSCIITGTRAGIGWLYKQIDAVLQREGIQSPYHWKEIVKKTRPRIANDLANFFALFKLKVLIINHERVPNQSRREYFLSEVPAKIAMHLASMLGPIKGALDILADDDINIKNTPEGTYKFLNALVQQLAIVYTGDRVTIRGK